LNVRYSNECQGFAQCSDNPTPRSLLK